MKKLFILLLIFKSALIFGSTAETKGGYTDQNSIQISRSENKSNGGYTDQ